MEDEEGGCCKGVHSVGLAEHSSKNDAEIEVESGSDTLVNYWNDHLSAEQLPHREVSL